MTSMDEMLQMLRSGIASLGLAALPDSVPERCLRYVILLDKWNKAYNLTAVRHMDEMIGRHILDSLAIRPWITGSRILDVGTGAGLPGIPLALACPDKHVVLLDSNGKKTRFLQEVKRVLELTNIEIVQSRVESYQPSHTFDTIVSRAFTDVKQMIDLTQHVLADHGVWIAMKGPHVHQELLDIQHVYRIEPYSVLGVDGERYCVVIEKV